MTMPKKTLHLYWLNFRKHDFRASLTVFFVALPLCLGVALASGAPVYSGLMAGIIGGLVVSLFSKSELSVSGPAAGLTAICAAAIGSFEAIDLFFIAVAMAGVLQIILGVFKLGGFTHFIPSAVIKGMLAAIGVLLISKQIPLLIGYEEPDFWQNELFSIITFRHVFSNMQSLLAHTSSGAILVGVFTIVLLGVWKKYVAQRFPLLPTSFVAVFFGSMLALALKQWAPAVALSAGQYVNVPRDIFSSVHLPDFSLIFQNKDVWQTAIIICFVASLETLLSLEAIDKLDPFNRISPQNRELVAQGVGNMVSGLVGGLPITAVIVRSAANAEAGGKTKMSSVLHGLWLLLAVLFAVPLLNMIPYSVLAVILIRTGYNLAKPSMVLSVYRQGREQFMPFIVTALAILFTDLLIGVLIGIGYAIFYMIKHTYRAGFTVKEKMEGHILHFTLRLALNVSFLNKKKLTQLLDAVPQYSRVDIHGTDSVYIDYDILEIIQNFKSKAHTRHIELVLHDVPEVETIELH